MPWKQSSRPRYWRIEIKPRADTWEADTGRTLYTPVSENATRCLAMDDVAELLIPSWHVHSCQGVEPYGA